MGQKDSKPRSYSLNSNEINDVARDTNAKPQDIKNIVKTFAKISSPDGKVSKVDFKKVYVSPLCEAGSPDSQLLIQRIEDAYGGGDSTITRMILLNFVRHFASIYFSRTVSVRGQAVCCCF